MPEGQYRPLPDGETEPKDETSGGTRRLSRLSSLDAFRGLSIALMIYVDYAGSFFTFIGHSAWNGLQLADYVMPFFLFIAGVSLSLVHKRISSKIEATQKAVLRALKLVFLGVLLQGGYFHGLNDLTYGVDLDKIRWSGILQRIAIGYVIAALCEIWLSTKTTDSGNMVHKTNYLHWVLILILSGAYLGLLYGLYVPDWQFKVYDNSSVSAITNGNYTLYTVKCGTRGNVGPACNSAGLIDRSILGINHLYKKPVYRNMVQCKVSENIPSWCLAPFDPEGILGSLMAAVTCILGLQYGHILIHREDHKQRLFSWLWLSFEILAFGLLLTFLGIPINKSLYTTSYTMVTTAVAGFTFCIIYFFVDMCGERWAGYLFEFIGRHSLSIFILIPSNLFIIVLQGFYWKLPKYNLVHWVVSLVVHK